MINTKVGIMVITEKRSNGPGSGRSTQRVSLVLIIQLLGLYYYLYLIKVLKHSHVLMKCFTIYSKRENELFPRSPKWVRRQ